MSDTLFDSQELNIVNTLPVDPEEFQVSGSRFRTFFQELATNFIEREEVLHQIALALLGREHVLLTGPPGNAKSQLSHAVLGRILDEQTGKPSVFMRQFTENTVQTDLVGPIDFKTLMETGRTEHFTDEGMLGAVHAFLDEVFDGRDMLLRSTLNVLQERELKQGTKTTRGQIESALMTSNRYLSEILEGSRDTLLAFIDRIAFISFVPKGFADEENLHRVIQRQVGEGRNPVLQEPLLIQDLDILQAVTDSIFIPDSVCIALAKLLEMLEVELSAAMRADPQFVPTRYLSTRTAVRAGKMLKAICVHNKLFSRPERVLEVELQDLHDLRLQLLLGGQSIERVSKLLAKETNPRERRQLEILRTEREIFDRCMARIPRNTAVPAPTVNLEQLRNMQQQVLLEKNTTQLVEASRKLSNAISKSPRDSKTIRHMLEEIVQVLVEQALSIGSTLDISSEQNPEVLANTLSTLADNLEQTAGNTRPLARWLRGRALFLIEEAAQLAPIGNLHSLLDASEEDTPEEEQDIITLVSTQSADCIKRLLSLGKLRTHILAEGADITDSTENVAWSRALQRVADELVLLWDEAFRKTVQSSLQKDPPIRIDSLLEAVSPILQRLDTLERRLAKIGTRQQSVKSRVVGPRMRTLVQIAFSNFHEKNPESLVQSLQYLYQQFEGAGIADVLSPKDMVFWAANALVRMKEIHSILSIEIPSLVEYQKLQQEVLAAKPISNTLLEVALLAIPEKMHNPETPESTTSNLFALLRQLPEELRSQVIQHDLYRLERGVSFLESWWNTLQIEQESDQNPQKPSQAIHILETVVSSGFLRVIRNEETGVRLAVEAKAISEIFTECQEEAQSLRKRLQTLEAQSSQYLIQLLQQRSENAWDDLLSSRSQSS